MDAKQARAAVLDGKTVRMVVGESAEDPTLLVYLDDGCVMSRSVGGWSEGVLEPVCDAGSDFLLSYLDGRCSVELAA